MHVCMYYIGKSVAAGKQPLNQTVCALPEAKPTLEAMLPSRASSRTTQFQYVYIGTRDDKRVRRENRVTWETVKRASQVKKTYTHDSLYRKERSICRLYRAYSQSEIEREREGEGERECERERKPLESALRAM